MKQGMLSTEINIEAAAGKHVDGAIDKEQAKRLYGLARQLAREWREKRRVRGMEEDRARAGGVYMGSTPAGMQSPAANPAPEVEDPVAELSRAKACWPKS